MLNITTHISTSPQGRLRGTLLITLQLDNNSSKNYSPGRLSSFFSLMDDQFRLELSWVTNEMGWVGLVAPKQNAKTAQRLTFTLTHHHLITAENNNHHTPKHKPYRIRTPDTQTRSILMHQSTCIVWMRDDNLSSLFTPTPWHQLSTTLLPNQRSHLSLYSNRNTIQTAPMFLEQQFIRTITPLIKL